MAEVDFYVDGDYYGRDTVGTAYSIQVGNLTPGNHALTAIACGNGLCATSSVVSIIVTNVPALVRVITPGNNTVKTECADVLLAASASPLYGSVTNVAYYLNGSTLLGSATQSPYLLTASLPTGINHVTAVARDDSGGESSSPPTVIIFSPTPTNALSACFLTSGQFKLCFRGLVNSNYIFESATTLTNPDWKPFTTNLAPASGNGLIDVPMPPVQHYSPEKFYRARRQP